MEMQGLSVLTTAGKGKVVEQRCETIKVEIEGIESGSLRHFMPFLAKEVELCPQTENEYYLIAQRLQCKNMPAWILNKKQPMRQNLLARYGWENLPIISDKTAQAIYAQMQ
jgi:hypothetical protein